MAVRVRFGYYTVSSISHMTLHSISMDIKIGREGHASYLASLVRSLTEGGNP